MPAEEKKVEEEAPQAPEAEASAPAEELSPDEQVWADFSGEYDLQESDFDEDAPSQEEPPQAAAEEPAEAEAPPETASPELAPPPTPSTAAPQEVPAAPAADTQQTAPTAPAAPNNVGEQPQQAQEPVDMEAQRQRAFDELTKHYALTPEQTEQVLAEPEKVLPQMAAKIFMDAYATLMSQMQAGLPQMIDHRVTQRTTEQQAADDFYRRWPQLQGDANFEEVMRIGRVYRSLYPDATKEDFIENVGMQAHFALKIPIEQEQKAQAAPAAQAAPSAPPAPAGVASPQKGSGRPREDNPFAALAEEMLQDDRGF